MVRFGNVELKKPITIASGPLTDEFVKIKDAAEHGAGAVSLKLTFVEVPFQSQMRSFSLPGSVIISPTNKRLDLAHGIELMREIKAELDVPMFANFSALGNQHDFWKRMSEEFTAAGSDMLEPNFCCPNLDTSDPTSADHEDHGGASIGENAKACFELVTLMKKYTDIPIVPKIVSSDRSTLIRVSKALEEAGADGVHVVGFPISGLPPLTEGGDPDIPLLDGIPQGSTNGSVCRYSTYLAVAQMAQVVDIPIMGSGGLDSWKDCIDLIHWGASAPSVCSAPMWHGFQCIDRMNEGIQDFMDRHGYTSFDDFRGVALDKFTTPDKVRLVEGAAFVDAELCIGCGRCTRPGHCTAIAMTDDSKAEVDPEKCIACGVCGRLCPTGAITYKLKEELDKAASS